MPPTVSMKQLLEAGVHFGHQTRRWNPKMARYIYGERNGIYIVDLQKTVKKIKEAGKFLRDLASAGEKVVFVGTKKQAKESIREEATRCGMFFVNQRWLGGTLTNFRTLRHSIDRLKELKQMRDDGSLENLTKKERAHQLKEIEKLENSVGGIQDMLDLPGCIFVVDTKKEHNAILEARKLGIPIVAIVDTNCDPDEVDYIIPGNDDAIRAVRLISGLMADACREGAQAYEQEQQRQQAAAEKEAEETEDVSGAAAPDEAGSPTAPAETAAASAPEQPGA